MEDAGLFKNLIESQRARGEANKIRLTFHNLSVSSVAPERVYVKTLARAVVNTFGPDQVSWLLKQMRISPPWIHAKKKHILADLTGIVNPGEMLLVLGRPGSGCSTFMRTTANRSTLRLAGDLRYAGVTHNSFAKSHSRETIYLPEQDTHIPALTVRQTIKFALRMSLPSEAYSATAINDLTISIARIFGLEKTLDTPVGGGPIPGISGGERKRVSIAETLAAGASVQCFDNSTRGLDSSTALDFVKALRKVTDIGDKTTIATLYQAGEDIFNHFDKVLILDEGREVFFGPVADVKSYFEELGFIQEPGQTTAEFCTSVTDASQRRYRPSSKAENLKTADDLAIAFKQSSSFAKLEKDVVADQVEQQLTESKSVARSFPLQVYECLKREVSLNYGKRQVHYTKWINTIILCLIVGSEYFDTGSTAQGAVARASNVFYAMIANAWMQYPELFDAHSNRSVLERQASLNMYRPAAVAIARVIVDLPLIAFQHLIFMIAYFFLANSSISYTAGDFFFFFFVLYLSTLSFANLLRMFAYYVPELDDCFRFGGIASTTVIFFAGFLIPINEMRPVWSWFHYISPARYAYESLLSTIFSRVTFDCRDSLIPGIPSVDSANAVCPIRGARSGQANVPGQQYVEAFGLSPSNRWRNVGILCAFIVAYVLIGVFGSQVMTFTSQGGAPIVFSTSHTKTMPNKIDSKPHDEKSESQSEDVESWSEYKKESFAASSVSGVPTAGPSLVWQDVAVKIGEKEILRGVTGYVSPGDFVAICGASGAGKTTLLSHLSKTNAQGQLNGLLEFGNKSPGAAFKKLSGFAQQQDLHEGSATIREAFEFSALLRQPSTYSRQEKLAYVEHVLKLLDLTELQDALLGDTDEGLGVELKKRVTIGIELAARPKVLFADEPTSGLDSQGAASVLSYLKHLSQQGQAVLVTVHQPSASMFRLFDKVLALSSSGDQLYFGSRELILPYFERHGAVPAADTNPAEFILETIGAGVRSDGSAAGAEWSSRWSSSEEAKQLTQNISSIRQVTPSNDRLEEDKTQFNTSVWYQTYLLTWRMLRFQWRRPAYIYSKIWVHVIQSILIGLTFFQLGTSPHDLQTRIFGTFGLIFLINTIVNPILARFFKNRGLWLVREGPSHHYGWIALCNASLIAELPAILFTATQYYVVWYFLLGYPLGESAGYTFLIVLTYEVFEMTLGLALISVAADLKIGGLILVFLVTICNWFNGVVVPYDQIQVAWRYWVYYLNPLTYFFGGIITAVVRPVDVVCDASDLAIFSPPQGQTCGQYAGAWATSANANLTNPAATSDCAVCQYTTGDQYLATLNLGHDQFLRSMWAYWALVVAFIGTNIALVYFCTWASKVKRWKFF